MSMQLAIVKRCSRFQFELPENIKDRNMTHVLVNNSLGSI